MPSPIPWTLLFKAAFFTAAAGAFVLAVMPGPTISIEQNDKLNHILAFVVLAGLGAFGFPNRRLTTLVCWLAIFGAVIELVQAIPFIHRDCSLWDWITDCLAAGVVLGLIGLAVRWRLVRRTDP